MGLYGSKDQHPKLVGTSGEDELSKIQWWYCENCGHKHLKQYKKCPICNHSHGGGSKWSIIWALIALIQLPFTSVMILGILIAVGVTVENEQPTSAQQPRTYQQAPTKAEYIARCEPLDFDVVARNPNKYKGKYYSATGEVFQVMEDVVGVFVLMRVTKDEYGYWDDTIAATIELPKGGDRILEDDIITIYGKCYGLFTYETVLGSELSVPRIDAKYYDLISE